MKFNTIQIVTAALLTAFMGGCGTDYRMESSIDATKPNSTAWTTRLHGTKGITDPTAKAIHINPYTYNPANPDTYQLITPGQTGKGNANAPYYAFGKQYSWGMLFPNWANAFTNTSPPANNSKVAQLWLIYAPLYWKASESTNITGLTDDDRKYYRNDLQNALLQVIKESTEQHLSQLKATENNANLFLGAATLGLAGGASVAAVTASRALAAAAAGTAGARSLVNEQVYRNTFIESVIALIQKDQADLFEKIRQTQTNSIYNYTVEGAITDAKEYELRGSLYNGLALLQKAVQNQVNGITNSVPINQYVQLPQASSFSVIIPIAGTNNLTSITNVIASGSGFSLLDVNQISNSLDSVKAISAFASSDNQLHLTFGTTLTNSTVVTNILGFPYTLQNIKHTLQIQVTITVTNKP